MKKILFMIALSMGVVSAQAQMLGDAFDGLTKELSYDRMIPPYGVEVTFDKTVHILFPSAIKYVDLGSKSLMAGKADGAQNVLRVKATERNFKIETNFSVITEDGSFYTFNAKYANEPRILNIEMKDFMHDGSAVNRPNNAMEVYLEELGDESPKLVHLTMSSIHKENKRTIRHIQSKLFSIDYSLRGLFTHNGLLYFHTELINNSHVPYDIDYITFKIVDKKVAKMTAIQEQVIVPLRAYNYTVQVKGKSSERTVFTLEKFTIPDDKQLVVEMHEKDGGRHLELIVRNSDIVAAMPISSIYL
ncbi:MAG: conjugative transposon protein TraN [Rikenellaceae bacterium]